MSSVSRNPAVRRVVAPLWAQPDDGSYPLSRKDAVANGLCVKGKTGIEDIMLELEDTGEVTFITETGRGNPDRFDVLWRQIKIIDTCDT